MGFFENFLNSIETTLQQLLTLNLVNLSGFVTPIAKAILLLYVAVWGYKTFFGLSKNFLAESFFKVLKICFIVMLAVKQSYYQEWIIDIFLNTPEQIAKYVARSPAGMSALDGAFTKGMEIGKFIFSSASTNPVDYLQALFIIVTTGMLTIYSAFLIVLSRVALIILLSLGPVFILFALFDSTKTWFDAWVKQLLNYSVLSIFVYMILAFGIKIFTDTMNKTPTDSFGLVSSSKLVLLSFMLFMIFRQIPTMVAALTGGGILSSTSPLSALMTGAKNAKTGALASYQGAKGARSAYQSTANLARRTWQSANSVRRA